MKLRAQMLTLSLATLLVPAFGWLLLQELEEFLREGQQQALSDSARTMARSFPSQFETVLFGRERVLPLRTLDSRPALDGYSNDWPEAAQASRFSGDNGEPAFEVLGGRWQNQDFVFIRVEDATPMREQPPAASPGADAVSTADALVLYLRSERGLTRFRIQTAAPGPLLVSSQTDGGGQIAGHWIDSGDGYQLELALPRSARAMSLSLGVEDAYLDRSNVVRMREAGTLQGGRPVSWLPLAADDSELSQWLSSVAPTGARAWIVDRRGWVVADSGPHGPATARDPSWVERFIYRTVVGGELSVLNERPEHMVALNEPLVNEALEGRSASQWGGDPETAEIRNTVAEPVGPDRVLAALVLEANTDGALLFTNRTLGRLLLTSLLLTLALVAGLWFLATRLSRRVQSLSGAVSEAMSDAAHPRNLPMTGDRDELGELARNNARLLRAVADYTRYLRTLAGRLSHELKTPLAITRSSLDNLGSEPLGPGAIRYLDRAREGVDRQTAIVRAMSEASRLEAAVASADWETVDLAALVAACVEGYRSVYPGRNLTAELPEAQARCHCAPDLVAQALDKLVDNAVSLAGVDERITIGLTVKGNWLHLRVSNTGTRLPETLQDQLFDSLVSVRDPGAEGLHLGLGLHIVRLVVEAHGGSVEAANLPQGEGVVFTLHLPAS